MRRLQVLATAVVRSLSAGPTRADAAIFPNREDLEIKLNFRRAARRFCTLVGHATLACVFARRPDFPIEARRDACLCIIVDFPACSTVSLRHVNVSWITDGVARASWRQSHTCRCAGCAARIWLATLAPSETRRYDFPFEAMRLVCGFVIFHMPTFSTMSLGKLDERVVTLRVAFRWSSNCHRRSCSCRLGARPPVIEPAPWLVPCPITVTRVCGRISRNASTIVARDIRRVSACLS